MSTVVPVAYRCTNRQMRSVVLNLKQQMMTITVERVKKRLAEVMRAQRDLTPYLAYGVVKSEAEKASTSMYRNEGHNLDCGLSVWMRQGLVYLRPYGEAVVVHGLTKPRACVDFSFDDRTDKPDHISRPQWDAIRKVWWALNDDEMRLTLHVVDFSPGAMHPSRVWLWALAAPPLADCVSPGAY